MMNLNVLRPVASDSTARILYFFSLLVFSLLFSFTSLGQQEIYGAGFLNFDGTLVRITILFLLFIQIFFNHQLFWLTILSLVVLLSLHLSLSVLAMDGTSRQDVFNGLAILLLLGLVFFVRPRKPATELQTENIE